MTSITKHRLFLSAVAVLSLQFSLAQAQTNVPDFFAFGPPATPVWDISGPYTITNFLQGAKFAPLQVVFSELDLTVDAHGKVQGAGTTVVQVGSDQVGGDYNVSGKISGGGANTKVNFSVHCKGQGIIAGVNSSFNISANYNLTVNPAGTNLVGKTTGSAHFSNLGGGSIKAPVTVLPLPPGVDGFWNVTLSIFPFGNKLSGTALVLVDSASNIANTPSTRTLATKANGSVPKQSVAVKVKLSGTGNSSGTQLDLAFTPIVGASAQISSVKGKVLGQSVKN